MGIFKAHLNGFDFWLAFFSSVFSKWWAKVKRKLDEVFKQFCHDPSFLRTMERTCGSWVKVWPNSNLIQLPFNFQSIKLCKPRVITRIAILAVRVGGYSGGGGGTFI